MRAISIKYIWVLSAPFLLLFFLQIVAWNRLSQKLNGFAYHHQTEEGCDSIISVVGGSYAIFQKIKKDCHGDKSCYASHVSRYLIWRRQKLTAEGSILFFFTFAGAAFIWLWQKIQTLLEEDSKSAIYSEEDDPDRSGNTMLFLALAVGTWQLMSLVSFLWIEASPWKGVTISSLSAINSAFFLTSTLYYNYEKPPNCWLWKKLSPIFQTGKGITWACILVIAITILSQLLKTSKNHYINWSVAPDIIFSIPTVFFLFYGMGHLFKERNIGHMRLLLYPCVLLTLVAQVLLVYPPKDIDELLIITQAKLYTNVAYQLTLIALSLVLCITWLVRIVHKKQIFAEKAAHTISVMIKEKEDRNEQLTKLLRETSILKTEVAHRVKNHLYMLSASVSDQMRKYTHAKDSPALNELKAVKARLDTVYSLYELLNLENNLKDDASFTKKIDYVSLDSFFTAIFNALKKIFTYPNEGFQTVIDIHGDDEIKVPIAKEIGMLITELVINIDQHAYPEIGMRKKVFIEISISNANLKIKVRDEGIGTPAISRENAHAGHGIEIVNAIVKQFDGMFRQTSIHPGGTTSLIIFKIKNLQ